MIMIYVSRLQICMREPFRNQKIANCPVIDGMNQDIQDAKGYSGCRSTILAILKKSWPS
jgi:hypothetical protein